MIMGIDKHAVHAETGPLRKGERIKCQAIEP